MSTSNLLKEAIADAKAVRETAIANAKLALEEAFTPKLQSMLSRKIEEEMEDDEEDIEEQTDSSNVGSGDNVVNQASGDDEEKAETDKSSDAPGTEGDEDTVVDKLTEDEDEDYEDVPTEGTYGEDEELEDEPVATEDEDSELDAELAEIIRELEADEEEVAVEDEEFEDEPVATEHGDELEDEPVAVEDEELEDEPVAMEDEDEELDLDEIIKSLREDDDDDEDDEEAVAESEDGMEGESEKLSDLTEALRAAYRTIRSLKGTINEVNLLNGKLLYSNKLFRSHNLTEGQKMRVIETFDRAANIREVKLVFTTLAESLSTGATKKSPIREALASKATRTTKPKRMIIESNQFTNRMKKLAGLL